MGEETIETAAPVDVTATAEEGSADMEKGDDAERPAVEEDEEDTPWSYRMWEVFTTFWPLGLVAFGGPQAHVAILRDHLVVRRNWMDEDAFTELFAIGQGLPGPTSTQLVVSTALARAGPLGGLMAFFLWNLPGLLVLTTCGVLITTFVKDEPWYLIGLPPAAISLVFKAFYGFGLKLDQLGIAMASVSCCLAILVNGDEYIPIKATQWIYPTMLFVGGLFTWADYSFLGSKFAVYTNSKKGWDVKDDRTIKRIGIPLWVGGLLFLLWAGVLIASIVLKDVAKIDDPYLDIFETMFRIGSLIFGGGQVVLPMLEGEVVPDWMTKEQFFQGLGLAQSMPGPLFNFSSYLGAIYQKVPGALVAYVGLFGPGVVLIFAMVPFWAHMRHLQWFKAVLHGLNATAIGFVGAACVILWEKAVENSADAIVFTFTGTLVCFFKVQAPVAIVAGGLLGAILFDGAASLGQVEYCDA